jgi:hypothetical protein
MRSHAGLKTHRVIGFFPDKKKLTVEFKAFKQTAQQLTVRNDLRIAYVSDLSLVKSLQEDKGLIGSDHQNWLLSASSKDHESIEWHEMPVSQGSSPLIQTFLL